MQHLIMGLSIVNYSGDRSVQKWPKSSLVAVVLSNMSLQRWCNACADRGIAANPAVEKSKLLAMFDLLQKEGLDKPSRERVKQASRDLLASLKARLEKLDRFWEKEQTKADIEVYILDEVFARAFRHPPFTPDEENCGGQCLCQCMTASHQGRLRNGRLIVGSVNLTTHL